MHPHRHAHGKDKRRFRRGLGMRLRRGLLAVCAGPLCAAAIMAAAQPASAGSLYSGPSPRPGPDILYAPPASAPQLSNAGTWHAPPILVSGASAYRGGEFLYQDFLYDDHGAAETPDPQDQRSCCNTFSVPAGTYTYPTNPAYANNAADLVEARVKPLPDATAFRISLNTMTDPSLVAYSIAIGGTEGAPVAFPAGANVKAPADMFLTVHPSGSQMVADLVHAGTNAPVSGPAPTVTVDTARHQIEVQVPHADWDPGAQTVRLAMGVGLWDKANNRYLSPQHSQDSAHPGGSGVSSNPPAFFNVAFRSNAQEPMPKPTDPPGTATRPAWWRDSEQATALASGDISAFHADVDFSKLAAGTDDETGVPQTGPMDRILQSHFQTAPGANYAVNCVTAGAINGGTNCPGQYQGNLQPYAIYVPRLPAPSSGYGMTLLLHSLGATYNQFSSSRNQWQFGERGTGSVVVTPLSRGPDGFYDSLAGADTFEVWADVARHYQLDPAWSVVTGYSMGGYGTFKLAEQFPDLFAKGQPTVGASQDNNLVASLRNIPFLMWNMTTDELVPESSYLPSAQAFDANGYRYGLDIFTGEHLTLAINDQYDQAASFLSTDKVNRDPPHVTFVVDPKLDYSKLGFVADHAYWLSNLKLRDTTPPALGSAEGKADVFSRGFRVADPPASPTQHGAGTLTGGTIPAIPYSSQFKTWGAAPASPTANEIDINATNLSQLTIDPSRARVNCAAALNVTTDGPLTVTLAGCNRSQRFP